MQYMPPPPSLPPIVNVQGSVPYYPFPPSIPSPLRQTQPIILPEKPLRLHAQIPERKGEKMIFHLTVLENDRLSALTVDCFIQPIMANQPSASLHATLYSDFQQNEVEQKVALELEHQVKRTDGIASFKNGQGSFYLNIPVTRRGLSTMYGNIKKPVAVYIVFELQMDDRLVAQSDFVELPQKDGKVKRAQKRLETEGKN